MIDVNVYSLHPWIHDVETFVAHYRFESLLEQFDFHWNPERPSYLFVSEEIYTNRVQFDEFFSYWKPVRNTDCIYIQYLEETIKPDLNLFDYAVCWDEEFNVQNRVIHILPTNVWMASFCPDGFTPAQSLDEARAILEAKTKFCNFMYAHADKERDALFHAIMKYKHVDALGKRFHNTDFTPTGFSGHQQETSTLREPYKFTIAGENGEYVGYTSEKIWTAYWGHSIPIYWGNPNIEKDINEKAFIHVRKYDGNNALLARIRQVDEDDDLWCRMLCEPFQTPAQILRDKEREQRYYAFFEEIFSASVPSAKRMDRALWTEIYQDWFRRAAPKGRSWLGNMTRKIKRMMHR